MGASLGHRVDVTDKIREHVDCPICGGDYAVLWGVEYQGDTLVRCSRCHLRYVNPRRTSEENEAVYGADYFTRHRRVGSQLDDSRYVLERNLKSIRRVFAHNPPEDPRILDIGTGAGFLPRLFKLMGYKRVMGSDITEVNRAALAEFSIPLHTGRLSDLEAGGFEIITAHHVLEHVMEPNSFLRDVFRLLAPDGIVHLLLPNEGSLNSRIKSFLSRYRLKPKAFKHLSPGHHLYFYEAATLKNLLRHNGFDVLYLGTRAAEKRRNFLNHAFHGLLDLCHLNSWLEVVIKKTN